MLLEKMKWSELFCCFMQMASFDRVYIVWLKKCVHNVGNFFHIYIQILNNIIIWIIFANNFICFKRVS